MREWIVSSSVLILIIIALRHVLKGKIDLRLQYALWVIVLLRLVIPVSFVESSVSVMNIFQTYDQNAGIQNETLKNIPTVMVNLPTNVKHVNNSLISKSTATYNENTASVSYNGLFNWEQIAKIIWLIGIGAIGLTLIISNIYFAYKLKEIRYKTDIVGYPLPIYGTDEVETPCMFGLFCPVIYVTTQVLDNETVLRYVLEHEITHWRHKDHIWSLLRCMCLALHWYNPLVWIAAAYSVQDAELSCDETTLQRMGEDSRVEYGRTLIGLTCTKRNVGSLLSATTTMTGSKRSIKERIELVAKKNKMATYTLIAVLLIAAVAVGCTFTGAKDNKNKIVPLTEKEVQRYNKIFEPLIFDEQGNDSPNPLSHFFTSYYDKPEDIDLPNFLRYFPPDEDVTDETEFKALKEAKNWPFGDDIALKRMPVPIHKFSAKTVNEALQKNMGITLDDLSGVGTKDLIYIKEYDAYYNFTSDFAAGIFYCTHGETQGDIVRLFNEFVTLTLKKQGDDYLFISHQRIGEGTDANSATKDLGVAVSIKPRGYIPEAVLNYAVEFVTQQVDYYNNEGKNLPSGRGTFAITKAKVTALTKINTGTASLTTDIQMWLLEYRLCPDNPGNVVLAGGMKMEDVDGESWITEWGSTGQPYLVLAHDIGMDIWQRICVTNSEVIMTDYGKPEMLERYGNEYTAASLELYRKEAAEQNNEINQKDILQYIEEGIYIPGDAKEYLEKKEFNNPGLLINNELQPIFDEYKETFDDMLLKGLQPIDILRLRNKAVEEENLEVEINLIILPPEINREDFLKEVQNDEVSKQNNKLLLEKYRQFNGKVIEVIINEGKAYVVVQGNGFWRFEKTENGVWKFGWLSRQ